MSNFFYLKNRLNKIRKILNIKIIILILNVLIYGKIIL